MKSVFYLDIKTQKNEEVKPLHHAVFFLGSQLQPKTELIIPAVKNPKKTPK